MIVTRLYRLLPSRCQHRFLEQVLESQRELYNAALEERIGAYQRGIKLSHMDQYRSLTQWRQSDPDARSIPANLQRATLKRLHEACRGFFRRIERGDKAGFPRFQGKGRWHSFGFQEFSGIALKACSLSFKGVPGRMRVHLHRRLPPLTQIRSCIFCRDAKGWKVGFAVAVTPAVREDRTRIVGLDLGITTFAALSDGVVIPSLRAARRAERRIRVLQRALSRKQKGSASRKKARIRLSRRYAAVTRARTNQLHQASAQLIRNYDVIALEALQVRGLACSKLAKDVNDAGWGRFLRMLRYKAEWAGAQLIFVDPAHTSQDCSGCGFRVAKRLDDRRHDCPMCGLSIDRDLNAARNILHRAGVGPGLRNVAGFGKRAGGSLLFLEPCLESGNRAD